MRITQQKTRSSSSISNTQKNATNLSSTQKAVLVNEQRPAIVPVTSLAAGETLKSGTHLKMAQMLQQPKGMPKLATMKNSSVKSRQNPAQDLQGALPPEIKQQAELLNSSKNVSEKEQKLSKSFQGGVATNAACKKQRQTLKGMIEGLNSAQTTSIPGSSSKRKSVSLGS